MAGVSETCIARARQPQFIGTVPHPSLTPLPKSPRPRQGPIASRRFASVGATIDVGEDVTLASVPGHLVCAFEAAAPASPNRVNPLDSDASSSLTLSLLEAEGCDVTVDGRAVPMKTAVLLKPGTVLGFGAECEYVVERNAFAHA